MARQYTTHDKFTRVSNAVAAGSTDVNTTGVLMTGYESILFITAFGTLTANAVSGCHLEGSDDDGSTDAYSALEGSGITIADDKDNGLVLVECVKPLKKYIRLVVDRATANAVIDSVVALQYNARKEPVTQPASVVGSGVTYSPAEGTP